MTFGEKKPTQVVVLIFVLLLCTPFAMAQSGAGAIQGTVKDPTGAVISKATVHVVNKATGVAINTKTNKVGFYHVPGLFTGTYTVTISAPGMKSYKTSIKLLVAQSAVINPVLTPGKVTQQVVVRGSEAQLLDINNGTITNTLGNQRINQLPMNRRSIVALIGETTPGMEDVGQRMNGQAREALRYVVDGVLTRNNLFGGQQSNDNHLTNTQVIDPDSVQQVRIEATDAGAQYGAPSTVIVTTKSGTNTLHGTMFETARNSAFGIAKSRQDPANFKAPPLVRNEFGVSVGGPIVFPHIYNGKNKSFFFFAYERYSKAATTASSFESTNRRYEARGFQRIDQRCWSAAGDLQSGDDSAECHMPCAQFDGNDEQSILPHPIPEQSNSRE